MNDFVKALLLELATPVLVAVLPIIAGAAVMGVVKLGRLVGVTVKQEAQDTLHSALMTGLRAAVQRGLTGEAAVRAAVDHAMGAGAKDTIAKLKKSAGLTAQDLVNIAYAKLDILQRGQVEDNKTAR